MVYLWWLYLPRKARTLRNLIFLRKIKMQWSIKKSIVLAPWVSKCIHLSKICSSYENDRFFNRNHADQRKSRRFRSSNSSNDRNNRSGNSSNSTGVNSSSNSSYRHSNVPFKDNRSPSRPRRPRCPRSPRSRFVRGNRPGTITRTSTSQRRKWRAIGSNVSTEDNRRRSAKFSETGMVSGGTWFR